MAVRSRLRQFGAILSLMAMLFALSAHAIHPAFHGHCTSAGPAEPRTSPAFTSPAGNSAPDVHSASSCPLCGFLSKFAAETTRTTAAWALADGSSAQASLPPCLAACRVFISSLVPRAPPA